MPKAASLLSPETVAKLSSVVLRARHAMEGTLTGIHRSPHKGSSVEFLEHTRYTPGDDLRNIDWKLLARSDRLFVKQFEDETNLRAVLVLDASVSMAYGPTGRSKLECARLSAAALAYLLLSQGDAVGLLTQRGDARAYVPPRSDWSHFRALAEALDGLESDGSDAWLEHLVPLAASVHKRGMFVILSDLLADRRAVVSALHMLRHRKHEVILLHVLHPWEIEFPFHGPTLFVGMEHAGRQVLTDPEATREEYLRRLEELCAFYRDEAAGLEMDYHLVRTDAPLEDTLVHYLAYREAMT